MAKHRLVALGDSLTQGVMSAAIFATDLSYPALIAREMGLRPDQFRIPAFHGFGGLPLNLEYILRRLEEHYGPDLGTLDLLGAPFRIRAWMDEIEDYWERGDGTLAENPLGIYHNLACWGMTVDDAVHLTAGHCKHKCDEKPASDNLFNQVPEKAFYRSAYRVLNPWQDAGINDRTMLDTARALAGDGGIENLLVALGANNALGTVTRLGPPNYTDASVLGDPVGTRESFNLWLPEHFDKFYRELADKVEAIGAERVFIANVPHVTIAPLARGVGQGIASRMETDHRFFKYYTYFWIPPEVFNPDKHPYLTGDQAKEIDTFIDAYNQTIKEVVDQRKQKGLSWHLVNLCSVLERAAFRRYKEIGEVPDGGFYEFPEEWKQSLEAEEIPELTTQYISIEEGRLQTGGLFSLDGVHPTTMGYGLVAHEFIQIMRHAGVPFIFPETENVRPDPVSVDFARLLQFDTLVRRPPGLLDDVVGILNKLDGWIGLKTILRTLYGDP